MDNQDKIVQYRFTAYLMKSIKHYRSKYIYKKELQQNIEILSDNFEELLQERLEDYTYEPLSNCIQSETFESVFEKVNERNLRILILHLVEDYSLKEIAGFLKLNYNTVLSVYSRTLKKIKNEMEDETGEL